MIVAVMKMKVMMLQVAALVSNIHPHTIHTIHVYNVPYTCMLLVITVDAKLSEGIYIEVSPASKSKPLNIAENFDGLKFW